MITADICPDNNALTAPLHPWDRLLDGARLAAVCWLLLIGLWSGPAMGATLVYPNGLLAVEIALAVILILSGLRGRVRTLGTYPLLWPCLGVLVLCGASALLRALLRGTLAVEEATTLWQQGEPMARGLLLYLAIAGQPRQARIVWMALLGGLALQTSATVIQHFTHVTRWYANLDLGWRTGWSPVRDPSVLHTRVPQPPRAQGLTSYINLTAAMLAAALPWWVTPMASRVALSRWGRLALLLGGATTAAALWYTNSRGPLIAILVTGLVFGLWRCTRAWRIGVLAAVAAFLLAVWPQSHWWALGAFLASGLLALVVGHWRLRYLLPAVFMLALAGGIQVVDASLLHYPLTWRVGEEGLVDHGRSVLYHDAVRTIAANPWWGVGDTAVARRVITLPGLHDLPRTQRNYHDQYLHWAAAEGIPVAIAFTLLVWGAVFWCWQFYPSWPHPLARALGLAATIGLSGFLLANLVDAHFWRIEGGGFFWSLLAVTLAFGANAGVPTKNG